MTVGSVSLRSISSRVVAMCRKSDLRDRLVSLNVTASEKVATEAPSTNIKFGKKPNSNHHSEFTSATLPTMPAKVDTDSKAINNAKLILLWRSVNCSNCSARLIF